MDNTILAGMSGIADGILKGLEIRQKRETFNRENDYTNAANTPGSPQSNAIKAQHTLLYSTLKGSGVLNDPESQKALEAWKGQIDDPNISGWSLDRTDTNPVTKMVTSLVEAKQKAKASEGLARLRFGEEGPTVDLKLERVHNANLASIDKDPTLTKLYQSSDNLNNAITNFAKGGATPQEFNELQQAVRNNTGIKGQGGVSERQETYLKSLGISGDKVEQFLTGDPQSVLKSDPAFAKQILGIANLELQNKQKQVSQQVDKIASGHKKFYGKYKDLAADWNDKVNAAKTRIAQPSDATSTQTNAHPEDDAALAWANANPDDPRAKAILKASGQ